MRPRPTERRSIIRGLLAADVIAAALFAIFTYSTEHSAPHGIGYFLILLLLGVAYSLIAIIVFVLPLLVFFERHRAIHFAPTLVVGLFVGAAMAAITEWPAKGLVALIVSPLDDHAVRRIWVFAAIGCASAIGFWVAGRDDSTLRAD